MSLGLTLRAVAPVGAMALVQVAANVAVAIWGDSLTDWQSLAVMSGGLSAVVLVSAWVALGPLSILPQFGVGVTALVLLVASQFVSLLKIGLQITAQGVLFIVLFDLGIVVGVAGMCGYQRYVRGWRLVPRNWPYAVPAGKPLRFSLRQLFLGTAAVAGLFALRNLTDLSWALINGVMAGLVSTIIIVPTMWLLIGTDRRRMGTVVDAGLLTAAGGVLFWQYALGNTQVLWPVVAWYGGLVVGLVWLWIAGLRLVRGRG